MCFVYYCKKSLYVCVNYIDPQKLKVRTLKNWKLEEKLTSLTKNIIGKHSYSK